jgi:DNA end-binding protein Ku
MPPRAMWKGAISFGLVTIPVAVYPATEEKSLKFNQLHDEDLGRIRYKRVCAVDGEEVDFDHIVKGYEVEKDRYVVLTDEDLDAVPVESSRAIDIQQFVDLDEIDPILFKKSYYLVPEETGAKAYALMREALEDARCSCSRRCTGPTRSGPPSSRHRTPERRSGRMSSRWLGR